MIKNYQKNHFLNLEEINLKTAEFIRTKRENRKLSIRELAKLAKLEHSIVAKLEGSISFKKINPTRKTLYKILSVLDSDFLELYQYVYHNII